jgi:hypothetical protein
MRRVNPHYYRTLVASSIEAKLAAYQMKSIGEARQDKPVRAPYATSAFVS